MHRVALASLLLVGSALSFSPAVLHQRGFSARVAHVPRVATAQPRSCQRCPLAPRMATPAPEPAAEKGLKSSAFTTVAIFLTLVSVKTATDLLTNCVARPPASAMALVTELVVFPLIALFLFADNMLSRARRAWSGQSDASEAKTTNIGAVFVNAVTDRPGRLLGIGLVYALDSLFYFYAQSNLGAVTYTVLAQTKIFFTVATLRLRGMLGKLSPMQLLGLLCLFAGANLVALKDVATGVAARGGNRALGIAGLLFAQACTAIANVAYERRLNEPDTDVWVRNVQLTSVITLWLAVSSAVRTCAILAAGGTPPPPAELLAAFCAPWVWLVVALKAATAVLISLTLKAGGNVLYAISKPWPVVIATLATCLVYGSIPSAGFLGGVLLSTVGILLYYAGKMAGDAAKREEQSS